ncbi:hypothetical protein [Halorubrum sp. N11]|uniref:hypothetical protein n=1 Tax=Halorubrum sp. N11 TaxID=3402276 RepID=UPI003EC09946
MTKSDLLEIRGVGEYAADALVNDGIVTAAELEKALRELEPSAGHIYSSFQLDVLDEFNLPTVGDQSVSQYTRRKMGDDELRYEWQRDDETLIIELEKEGNRYRAKWTSKSTEKPFRSGLYEYKSDAENALTRWAYRPPESR